MRFTTLIIVIALSCAACSEGDVQFNIVRVDAVDKESPANKQNKSAKQNLTGPSKAQSSAYKAETNKQEAQSSSSVAFSPSGTSSGNSTNTPDQGKVASVELVKENSAALSSIESDLLSEVEASLAEVDDTKLSESLRSKSSAIPLQLGSSSFSNGPVSLAIAKPDLISKVSSVSGATSITGDPTGFGFTIALSGDYLFDFDKDSLTPKAEAALKSVLTLYQEYDGTQISVAGHTDSKGSNQYNKELSVRRADSVKAWFTQNKVNPSTISTQGYGETKPIADNSRNGQDYPQGRALNRRVDISVKTNKKINHLPTVSEASPIN